MKEAMNPMLYIVSGTDLVTFIFLSLYGFVLLFFKYETNVYTPVCVLFPLSLVFFAHGLRINGWANEEPSFQGLLSALLTFMALPLMGSQLNLYATFSDAALLSGSAPGYRNVTSNSNANTSYFAAEKALVSLAMVINLLMSIVLIMYNLYFACWKNVFRNSTYYRRIALWANLSNDNPEIYVRPAREYMYECVSPYAAFSVESLARWTGALGFICFGFIFTGTVAGYVGYVATTSAYYPQFMDPVFLLSGAVGLHIHSFGLHKRNYDCFGNRIVLHVFALTYFSFAIVSAWYGVYRFNQTLGLTTAFSGLGTGCLLDWNCYYSLATATPTIDLSARYVAYGPWPDANVYATNSVASAAAMTMLCLFGTVMYGFVLSEDFVLWINRGADQSYHKLGDDPATMPIDNPLSGPIRVPTLVVAEPGTGLQGAL